MSSRPNPNPAVQPAPSSSPSPPSSPTSVPPSIHSPLARHFSPCFLCKATASTGFTHPRRSPTPSTTVLLSPSSAICAPPSLGSVKTPNPGAASSSHSPNIGVNSHPQSFV